MKKGKDDPSVSIFTYLKNAVRSYEGKSERQIKQLPSIFELLVDIHSRESIRGKEKQLLNAALSYLIAPRDVISEDEKGAFGFIDDLYLATYVLKQIKESMGPDILKRCWRGKGDANEAIEAIYKESILRLSPSEREKTLIYSGVEDILYTHD